MLVRELAEEIVRLGREYPDGKYEKAEPDKGCRYTRGVVTNGPENECGCIVGQAYVNVSEDKQRARDLLLALDSGAPVSFEWVAEHARFEFEDDPCHPDNAGLVHGISLVQHDQDSGCTWSVAIQNLIAVIGGAPSP